MTHYSAQSNDGIFVKCCRYLFFFKRILAKFLVKYKQKLNHKYSQKCFDDAKQPATDAFKIASKMAIKHKKWKFSFKRKRESIIFFLI